MRTISPLLPKGQHPLQNRSIFLPLPHCDPHWCRALSCPTGTGRAQPCSDSPCPAAAPRLGSGASFGQVTCFSAALADSPSPGSCRRSGDAGCAPRQPPGLGYREQVLNPGAGGTAALADRWELASPGKGKPRHTIETRAPLSPARPRCGWGGGGGAPRGSGAAAVSVAVPPPSPRGGGPPKPKGKALLSWPLFLEWVPAAEGRDKGGDAAACRRPRGWEGPPPPAPLRWPAHMHSHTATTTSGVTLFIPFPMA